MLTITFCAPGLGGGFDPWTQPACYELEYRVDLGPVRASKATPIRLWLPMPAENNAQKVLSEKVVSPWPWRKTRDGSGNRLVYLETGGQQVENAEIVMRFIVQRSPSQGIRPSGVKAGTPLDPRRHLKPQRQIPLDGEIAALAAQVVRPGATDAQKIRAFYDYVTGTMRYSKRGTGWGRGDAVWACRAKYGNCTDFHSLLIGLARSQGVPARFIMGFPIAADKDEGEIAGYHCWAEAYDRERGWIPMDASEAWKSKRFDDYFGKIPSDRVEFTAGRDLVLEPRQAGEPLNFLIYPYAEVEDKPVGRVPWKLRFKRVRGAKADG